MTNPHQELFPSLPLETWEDTKNTVHLYTQIVGKIRLALMPRKNHWWYITLYVNARGLGTSPIPYDNFTFEINFDFIDHTLNLISSRGTVRSFSLHTGLSVAEFYQQLFSLLEGEGIQVKILAKPYDCLTTEPFKRITKYASYDKEYVQRFWHVLVQVDQMMKEFSGRFYGKTCPVHLYWHHFDLTVTRFSGKRGPEVPFKTVADKDAYSHEVISAGFWPGDENVRGAAFYSYTYPSPEGLDQEPLLPAAAQWVNSNGSPMALLMYDDLRKENNPKQAILDFLESTYQAGAKRAKWDIEDFKVMSL